MYLLYVEYSNYTETFNKTSKFLRYHYSQCNERYNINKIIEKGSIRWFSIDTLLNCIENKEKGPISLRGVFHKTVESCKDQLIQLNK